MSRGSGGVYQADEQAGVAPQLAIIKQMTRQLLRGSAGDYQADEQAGAQGSAVDYQADEQAGVTRLSWPQSSR